MHAFIVFTEVFHKISCEKEGLVHVIVLNVHLSLLLILKVYIKMHLQIIYK